MHRCGRAGRDGRRASVYGFFTRELRPLAPSLTSLLESCGAWVDPNLRELAAAQSGGGGRDGDNEGGDGGGRQQSSNRRRGGKGKKKTTAPPRPDADGDRGVEIRAGGATDPCDEWKDDDNDDYDDGQFKSLVGNRIVLKRAGHISDASDSDS